MKRIIFIMLFLGALIPISLISLKSQAHVAVSFGIGLPTVAYPYSPVYVAPQPVYVQPQSYYLYPNYPYGRVVVYGKHHHRHRPYYHPYYAVPSAYYY